MISINGMEFFAHHGCFAEERIVGTHFLVDLSMEYDTSKAEISDNLEETIDYQEVYQLVKKEMEISSNLLEHVGRRIINSIENNFPQIGLIELEICKLNPPLGGKMHSVSIQLDNDGSK